MPGDPDDLPPAPDLAAGRRHAARTRLPQPPATRPRRLLASLPLLLLALALAALALLLRPPPPAVWVTLRADDRAPAGGRWHCTATLQTSATGFLGVDLHDAGDAAVGCLGVGPTHRLQPGANEYQFAVPLPAAARGEVFAVLVLSTDGSWLHRTQVAVSAPLPVGAPRGATDLPVHAQPHERPAEDRPVLPLRAAVALPWLAAALLLLRRRRRGAAIACALVAAVELAAAAPLLAAALRALWQRQLLYGSRRLPQVVGTGLVLCGCAGGAGWALGRRGPAAPIAAAVCLYLAVAGAGLLSLHEVDRLLTWRGLLLPLGALLRMAAGLLALLAARRR